MLGEGFLGVHPFRGVGVVIGSGALLARGGVTAPFAIVRAHFNAAVAVPAVGQGGFSIKIAFSAC